MMGPVSQQWTWIVIATCCAGLVMAAFISGLMNLAGG